ncbi:MAG: DUF1653 domain-containing protein [Candidatus Saccharimonadales bacterium]
MSSDLPSLSPAAESLRLGRYRHYKDKYYQLIGIARHSETLEELVVYQAEYDEGTLWVRPLSMFIEAVEVNGVSQPRFTYLG